MQYTIFYTTDNGKRFFERVNASSEKEAIRVLKDKYNDIEEIVKVSVG